MSLSWLPKHPDFRSALETLDTQKLDPKSYAAALVELSQYDLDFVEIANIDRRFQRLPPSGDSSAMPSIRLAVLGSSTLDQIIPSLRVACLRRGVLLHVYLAPYNQFRQELLDAHSSLFTYKPDGVLLVLDPEAVGLHLSIDASLIRVNDQVAKSVEDLSRLWSIAQKKLGATVIQQNILVPSSSLFGELDCQVAAAPTALFRRFNGALATHAAEQKVLLLDVESLASKVGKYEWFNWPLWFHGKQAISPAQAPLYADHVARLLAALRGLSKKCIALDLDNTLWGGVIGDDGLEGIELGEGSGRAEAFSAFQHYLKRLSERGVLLAVCSKNDEANARLPFKEHPEMVLKETDIAAFVANWDDKAANLSRIAHLLSIGIDALVFVDDNPVERRLVRQFSPGVSVPELPEDAAGYVSILSDAGYFEAITFTVEDAVRSEQYQANRQRESLRETHHDLDSFLRDLHMEMEVGPFDSLNRPRIAQLVNKSNQFNLTTRRYTEEQLKTLENRSEVLTLQVRLKDACGDNGMISVIIAKPSEEDPSGTLSIDTWLMSCRVLGRKVEQEVLNVLSDLAKRRGFHRLEGEYIPTAKNALVENHFAGLGFQRHPKDSTDTAHKRTRWELLLNDFVPKPTPITTHLFERNS